MKFVTTVNGWLDRFILSRKPTVTSAFLVTLSQACGLMIMVAGLFGSSSFGMTLLRIAGACIFSCSFPFFLLIYLNLRKKEAEAKASPQGDT